MKKIAAILLTILFLPAAFAQTELVKRLDSLTAVYENNGYHGVVLVAKGHALLYHKGYGYANFEQKVKQFPQTQFLTESVGKMFTATAILQLVERDKLSLNHSIKELLPDLKVKNSDKITIHHLLNHTSGLKSPWDHPAWNFKKHTPKPNW